jgi:hypothetical protein
MIVVFSIDAIELLSGDLLVLNLGVLEAVNQIGAFDDDSSFGDNTDSANLLKY